MCCPLVFEFSVGIGGFVIGLGQISFFFSSCYHDCRDVQEDVPKKLCTIFIFPSQPSYDRSIEKITSISITCISSSYLYKQLFIAIYSNKYRILSEFSFHTMLQTFYRKGLKK